MDVQTLSKSSVLGLAIICISAGVNQIIRPEGLISGIILLIFGFGFIAFRDYLKAKYSKKKR